LCCCMTENSDEGELSDPYMASSPSQLPKRRQFCYDWGRGFVSPYLPTKQELVTEILDALQLSPQDVIFDLGCGDGRFINTAVQRFCSRGVGIDLDGKLLETAWQNAQQAGLDKKVEFREEDLLTVNLEEATVIIVYLLPEALTKIGPKLHSFLSVPSPRRWVVSVTWSIDTLSKFQVHNDSPKFIMYNNQTK